VIRDGLKPGERVAVEGQHNLRPGVTVQPKPVTQSRDRESAATSLLH